MIDKLGLPTQRHPSPYSLSWLKKGTEIKVDRRCLVEFSIGAQLREQVWCDVVPMDACHILLGRPWQYDRSTTHDGHKNTYTFVKDGKKVVLLPWKGAESEATSSCGLAPRTTLLPEEPDDLQKQIEELFAASIQPYQSEQDLTKEVLLQIHTQEFSGDPFELTPIEMILPPDPLKSETQLLLGYHLQPQLEYKCLPTTVIPKVDLTWVRVKAKKLPVGSLSRLRCKTNISVTSQGDTTTLFVKKASPPLGENDGDVRLSSPLPSEMRPRVFAGTGWAGSAQLWPAPFGPVQPPWTGSFCAGSLSPGFDSMAAAPPSVIFRF